MVGYCCLLRDKAAGLEALAEGRSDTGLKAGFAAGGKETADCEEMPCRAYQWFRWSVSWCRPCGEAGAGSPPNSLGTAEAGPAGRRTNLPVHHRRYCWSSRPGGLVRCPGCRSPASRRGSGVPPCLGYRRPPSYQPHPWDRYRRFPRHQRRCH